MLMRDELQHKNKDELIHLIAMTQEKLTEKTTILTSQEAQLAQQAVVLIEKENQETLLQDKLIEKEKQQTLLQVQLKKQASELKKKAPTQPTHRTA